jgi:hypothetical protein
MGTNEGIGVVVVLVVLPRHESRTDPASTRPVVATRLKGAATALHSNAANRAGVVLLLLLVLVPRDDDDDVVGTRRRLPLLLRVDADAAPERDDDGKPLRLAMV